MARRKPHPALVYRCYSVDKYADEHAVLVALMEEVSALPWVEQVTIPYVFPLVTGHAWWYASAQVSINDHRYPWNRSD